MLRSVAEDGEGVPLPRADGEDVALAHGAELRCDRRDELPVVIAALAERLDLRLGDAVAAVVGEALVRVPAARALPGELSHQPLGLRAPQLHAEAPREPVGIAHVVRVEVGDEDADDGAIRELAGEQRFPQLARRR